MRLIALALLTAAVLAGCSETGNEKYDACTKQANQIASTQGVKAGSAALDQCVDNLANGVY